MMAQDRTKEVQVSIAKGQPMVLKFDCVYGGACEHSLRALVAELKKLGVEPDREWIIPVPAGDARRSWAAEDASEARAKPPIPSSREGGESRSQGILGAICGVLERVLAFSGKKRRL